MIKVFDKYTWRQPVAAVVTTQGNQFSIQRHQNNATSPWRHLR